jgi:glyoxylase-like metal-dependent hydrolase (beta-lactamase superfamily II)
MRNPDQLSGLIATLLLAACGSSPPATTAPAAPGPTAPSVHIDRVAAPGEGIFANAYLIETADGVIVVDTLLRVSDARALAARVKATGKPLRGILLTHGHPDHYNGAIALAGDGVPVIATAAVDQNIRAHDAAKEAQWRPMFGDEWPAHRQFPTRLVADGEVVELAGLRLQVHDVGPAESHADSYWTLEGSPRVAFIGDLAFSGTHAYLSDGHSAAWLAVLDRLERELAGATLYPGHGEPGGVELLAAQRRYLEAYRAAVRRISPDGAPLDDAGRAALVEAMHAVLPTEALGFLIGLGGDPVAAELAAESR